MEKLKKENSIYELQSIEPCKIDGTDYIEIK